MTLLIKGAYQLRCRIFCSSFVLQHAVDLGNILDEVAHIGGVGENALKLVVSKNEKSVLKITELSIAAAELSALVFFKALL